MRQLRISAFAALATVWACARAPVTPVEKPMDQYLITGLFYTMDPANPVAEAVVIRGDKFGCVGSALACSQRIPAGTRTVALGKGSAVPGLADSHGHVYLHGRAMTEVSCNGLASEEECVERAVERARELPGGVWLRGRGWDQNLWLGGRNPTERSLSLALPDRPVILERVDGHAVWVNARALEIAGITEETPDPDGGRIGHYADGRPNGILLDNAQALVTARIAVASGSDIEDGLLRGLKDVLALGLTSVHDAGVDADTLEVYRKLATEDRLPIRVYAMIDGQVPMPQLSAQMELWKKTPEIGRLTVRAVKLFADGALGSRGAALYDPYSDDPRSRGLFVTAPEELQARIAAVLRAGFQPAVHAIGDRACGEVLRGFAAAAEQKDLDVQALRPRVEHLQVLDARDAHLLKDVGAVASMQPVHATSDAPWAEERLGHGTERQKGAYAWRQVRQFSVPLAFGSDFPVESPDPRAGLESAETRSWMPEQRLSRDEALRAYTTGAAYASFAERRRGMIREGYDADLTAFSKDVMAVPARELRKLAVTHVIVGGRAELSR